MSTLRTQFHVGQRVTWQYEPEGEAPTGGLITAEGIIRQLGPEGTQARVQLLNGDIETGHSVWVDQQYLSVVAEPTKPHHDELVAAASIIGAQMLEGTDLEASIADHRTMIDNLLEMHEQGMITINPPE